MSYRKEFGFHLVIYSKGVKARRCPMQSQAIAIATIFFAEDHGVSTTWNNRLSRFSSHYRAQLWLQSHYVLAWEPHSQANQKIGLLLQDKYNYSFQHCITPIVRWIDKSIMILIFLITVCAYYKLYHSKNFNKSECSLDSFVFNSNT